MNICKRPKTNDSASDCNRDKFVCDLCVAVVG